MRLFLIDYENVNSAGLQGIGQLTAQDRVILFYSQSANTLSFDIMDEMLAANIMPERVCIAQSGKNALDFQLVTFLGYLIAKNKADEYYIISRDAGYAAAVTFCRNYLGTKVIMKPSIQSVVRVSGPEGKHKTAQKKAEPPVVSSKSKKKAPISLRKRATVIQVQPVVSVPASANPSAITVANLTVDTVRSLIEPPVSDESAAQILACLLESSSKTEFHNALQQCFGNDDVKEYYRCMKPCFAAALHD